MSASSLSGLLIIDKPGLPFGWQQAGQPRADYDLPTSHDVVQRVRRMSGQRRIGHTGTLDPMATGVLVLCLGQATRLVEYYQGHDKQYLAEVTLGTATDTYDALGQVTQEKPVPGLTSGALERALDEFRGEIEQRPPIFSAIKQGGESLHRKARRGEAIEIEARRITVHDLSLVDWIEPNRMQIRIRASAGTYVRSLAYDLGAALGTAGHLSALRREAAGPITLNDAHPLAQLADSDLVILLQPPGWALDLPTVAVDAETVRRLGFGQRVRLSPPAGQYRPGTLAKAIDEHGGFVGIIHCLEEADEPTAGAVWKAEKWFASK